MKCLNISNTLTICAFLFLIFTGCIQDISVEIPPHTPTDNHSELAAIPAQKICLKAIKDTRILDRAEGTREAAFGVHMSTVDFYPSVEDIFKDVIKAEFQRAGHTLVGDDQPITLSATVLTFEVATDTTPLYWDIIGKAMIELKIKKADRKATEHNYSSMCQERTYIFPSGELIQKVMKHCIAEFAQKLRNDPKLAQAIRN